MFHSRILYVMLASLLFLLEKNAAEVFSSFDDVANTFFLEREVIVPILEELATLQREEKREAIENYLHEYYKSMKVMEKDVDVYELAGNPIQVYLLMRRLYLDWQTVNTTLIEDNPSNSRNVQEQLINKIMEETGANDMEDLHAKLTGNPIQSLLLAKRIYSMDWSTVENEIVESNERKMELLDTLEQILADKTLPQEEDYILAAQSLFRLQETYELDFTDLIQGYIDGVQIGAELSAEDCFFIGQQSIPLEDYENQGMMWFNAAFDLADDNELENLKAKHERFVEEHSNNHPEVPHRSSDETFRTLCRGENLRPDELTAKLKCWYDHRNEYYLRLRPMLVEQHSIDPLLLEFHDVLSDTEIETLKNLGKTTLVRSLVSKNGKTSQTVKRTSRSGWLSPDRDPRLNHLRQKIAIYTGLGTDFYSNEAEMFQVGHYGVGGFYAPHFDYFRTGLPNERQPTDDTLLTGERMATFLIYLNDVEAGGATAFPIAKTAIFPVKGNVMFWYNLKRNGDTDPRTMHGACPVLFGEKWVSTLWIREKAQAFKRPCSSTRDE